MDIRDARHEKNLEVNYNCRSAQRKNYREQEFIGRIKIKQSFRHLFLQFSFELCASQNICVRSISENRLSYIHET